MAMKAYRDRAGVAKPEMVIPSSAHVAFDKAAHYLGFRQVQGAGGADDRADVAGHDRGHRPVAPW